MTQEDKAKAYDEALEKSKRLYEQGTITESLAYIFPELKESEDERIRKGLIYYFTNFHLQTFAGIDPKKIIAWLEKQVHVDEDEIVKGIRRGVAISLINHIDANSKGMCLSNMECEDIENAIVNEDWDKVYGYMKKKLEKQGEKLPVGFYYVNSEGKKFYSDTFKYGDVILHVEKQGEQKPAEVRTTGYWHVEDVEQNTADKVEPKFKNGQWIVWQDKCYKVINNGCCYELDDQNGLSTSLEYGTIDENARLWDITKDAKDGDVLKEDSCIFIIKKMNPNGTAIVHCCLCDDDELDLTGSTLVFVVDCTYPATKKQRDTLMKAMADAGYTFDFVKKELKKIEQKLADKPKFKVKYAGSEYNVFETKDIAGVTFYGIEDEPNHIDYVKADNCEIISGYDIKESGLSIPTKPVMFSEQKPAWSEGDEQRVENLLAIIEGHGYPGEVAWLKSLKERILPKQEWSEEDEKAINDIMWIIEAYRKNGFNETHVQIADSSENWLKSLRPQTTWKPSDEHYELEEFAKIVRGNLTGISKAAQELFEAKYLQLTGNKMYGGYKD